MEHKIGGNNWKKGVVLFLASQNVSLFGSSVVSYCVLWHITLATSSGLWVMMATLCATVPQVLVSLFGGVWADRYNRKALIMMADGFIASATFLLALALRSGEEDMLLLLVVLCVRSAGAGVQTPAVNAIFPQLVPQDQLTKIQGINQSINSVCLLLAPAAGGVVLDSLGLAWALMVDVVTAAAAIGVMSRIRVEAAQKDADAGDMVTDIRKGLQYAFSHQELKRLLICYAFAFFLITPAAVLTPLMIERTFGGEVWRLTANEVVWTVGMLIGGVLVSWRGHFKDKVRTVALCLVAFGILFGLLGVSWNFASYLCFMGIAGFFLPFMTTAQTVHVQEITAPDVLGRVFSILQILSTSAVPVAILFFGPLADMVRVESILAVSGILLALVGVAYGWKKGG